MTFEEINQLDFSNIGDWPGPVKALLILIVCALIGVGWYYFDTQDQLKNLEQAQKKEVELRQIFEEKQAKTSNLAAYQEQLDEIRDRFGNLLRQLPNKTEVADLLVDVSQTGLASGLEFELFKPTGEAPRDFYAELPIKISVLGSYHEFGSFVSGLAALPRIVTVHDIAISKASSTKGKKNSNADGAPLLKMDLTAKTYRYLDEGAG